MQQSELKIQKILYLGLDGSRYRGEGEIIHLPIIEILPKSFEKEVREAFLALHTFSHVLLTSRTAAKLYLEYGRLGEQNLSKPTYIIVGKATAEILQKEGLQVAYVAEEERAEGMIDIMEKMDLRAAHLFLPRSSLGRDLIPEYCQKKKISLRVLDLYETKPKAVQLPNLEEIDKIIFTSPSTVEAFFAQAPRLPKQIQCCPIGPITGKALAKWLMPEMFDQRHAHDDQASCAGDAEGGEEGA